MPKIERYPRNHLLEWRKECLLLIFAGDDFRALLMHTLPILQLAGMKQGLLEKQQHAQAKCFYPC